LLKGLSRKFGEEELREITKVLKGMLFWNILTKEKEMTLGDVINSFLEFVKTGVLPKKNYPLGELEDETVGEIGDIEIINSNYFVLIDMLTYFNKKRELMLI